MKENEKMKNKNEKMKKNDEKRKKMKKFGFTRKNPRRFPGFTVVVVTFFVKILDDFHDFVSECVFFLGKSTTRFAGSPFFLRTVTIFIGRETKTQILPTKIND